MGIYWVICLGAFLELASSQVLITVKPSNVVKENDYVVTTCSYPLRAVAVYRLAVNDINGPSIRSPDINSSEFYNIMSILEGNLTLRNIVPTVVVDFSFNARRDYDGYNMTCVVTSFGRDDVSTVIPLHVRHGPCCSRTARDVLVNCALSDHFMLNASDVVEDAGNPRAVVSWTYSNKWSADPVGDLSQILKVKIPSIVVMKGLIQASATNGYGNTSLDFQVQVIAIRVPPRNLTCNVYRDSVACGWSPLNGNDGDPFLGYRILLKNSIDDVITNGTTQTTSYSFNTSATSFISNAMHTVEVRARTGTCEGPGARHEVIAPGPPSSPQRFGCSESSATEVLLKWASPVYNHPDLLFLGFVVSYVNENETFVRVLPRSPPSQLQQEVGGLEPSTMYYFNVTAENEFGISEPAHARCTTSAPGTPTAVSLNQPESLAGGVRLSWTAPNPGMTGVYIRSYNVAYQCGCGNEISKDVGNVTTTDLSDLGENMRCTFTVTATNTIGLTSPTTGAITRVGTTGAETTSGEQSGSVQPGAVAGIAVGCFIVGCLVGIVGTAVTVHWSWSCKHAKTEQCRSTEEHVTDSSAYELPARMQSQATYADVLAAEQQQTSPRLTANPAYSTN